MIDKYDQRPYYDDKKNRRRNRRIQSQKDKEVFDKYTNNCYNRSTRRLIEDLQRLGENAHHKFLMRTKYNRR